MAAIAHGAAACVLAVTGAGRAPAAEGVPPTGAAAATASESATFSPEDVAFFETKIRPLLAAHCQSCHGPEQREGGLRLDSRDAVLVGGETGPAIAPGHPDDSLLIDAVQYGDLYQMPPKQQLPALEIALLAEWVRRGAPWPPEAAPAAAVTPAQFDLDQRRRNHWAWRPIATVAAPRLEGDGPPRTTIDAFLEAKRRAAGVHAAPPAESGALLRRASFDLIGLPPTPAELAAFAADDSPEAFARVVDRLLASPRFGERWARHWLDLVRYSETLGHEFDYPVTGAWRYRDYVIRALNADLAYDRFVKEHIAGDLLEPRLHPTEGYNESVIATAFWFMGEALHAPVDSQADHANRIDNQIDVMSKAFLGLTVACARCHDHKFDAISTQDYYALAGYLASSHQQDALLDPGRRIETAAASLATLQAQGRDLLASSLPVGDDAAGEQFAQHLLACRAAAGVEDAALRAEIARSFGVTGSSLERFLAAIADRAAQEPAHPLYVWNRLAQSQTSDEAFLTRRSALESAVQQQQAQAAAVADEQQVFEDFSAGFARWFRSGWAFGDGPTRPGDWLAADQGPQLLSPGAAHSGRYGGRLRGVIRSQKFTINRPYVLFRLAGRDAQVRLVVDGYQMDKFTPLLFEGLSFPVDAAGQWQWHVQSVQKHLGHRAHLELIDDGHGYLAIDEIRFADSPATPPAAVGLAPHLLADADVISTESLARAYGRLWALSLRDWQSGRSAPTSELVLWAISAGLAATSEPLAAQRRQCSRRALDVDAELPEPDQVVAIADGSGDDQRVFIRGNYKALGEPAPRRLLAAIAGPDQPPPPPGSGRLELAERMLAEDNPFVPRVMANRIWQRLLGRGLVATVDNFGVLGEPPTHPELLDYLAARFREQDWSIKRLIREIMLTDAYQMASTGDADSLARDPSNAWLHRQRLRRLEGEAIRDALLAVSGELDPTPYGPSVPIHLTPFMEGRGRPEQSGPLDGLGRRSIYVETRRNFLSPFMLAFDAPTPASTAGRRNVTNVPAQALALMNDPLVAELCRHWGDRIAAATARSVDQRVGDLYLAAYSRAPSERELSAAVEFVQALAAEHDAGPDDPRPWAELCHVLVNVKEFVFVP